MLYNAIELVKSGLLIEPVHVQFVFGIRNALPAKKNILEFQINELKKWGKQKLLDHGFDHVDYIEIYNENNFSEIGITRKNLRVFAAATLGKVRLIDNCVVR